jgi:mitochondrial fission protein ELM1
LSRRPGEPRPRRFTPSSRQWAASPISLWDGTGENPYFAFLATADAIVTTEDSVNMVTEATGTGKPV